MGSQSEPIKTAPSTWLLKRQSCEAQVLSLHKPVSKICRGWLCWLVQQCLCLSNDLVHGLTNQKVL